MLVPDADAFEAAERRGETPEPCRYLVEPGAERVRERRRRDCVVDVVEAGQPELDLPRAVGSVEPE